MRSGLLISTLVSVALSTVTSRANAQGVPNDGFPSWQERTVWVLVNRDRADPGTALAPCIADGGCPDADCFETPLPPLAYNFDLNRSARLQPQLLAENNVFLMHPSPCVLSSNIGTTYPDECDGGDACACQTPVQCSNPPDTQSCDCTENTSDPSKFTAPFTRIRMFAPGAGTYAENIAGGAADPMQVEQEWLLEDCPCCDRTSCQGVECPSTEPIPPTNGHRANLLSTAINSVGLGAIQSPVSDCYGPGSFEQPYYWAQDFAYFVDAAVQKLVAGSHFPQSGTSLTFYANWFDPVGGVPASASVIIDGKSNAMSVDRGSGGNATYVYAATLPANSCKSYTFAFTDSSGEHAILPVSGSYLAGDTCAADFAAGGGCATGAGEPWFGVLFLAVAGLRPLGLRSRNSRLGARKLTNRQ